MKKFGKFLTGTAILAGLAAGALYVYKNFVETPSDDDLDDTLEVDEDDLDTDETADTSNREYVSIDISGAKETDEEA